MPEADARHLTERSRQAGVHRFAGDQHAGLLADGKQRDALGSVRNAVAEYVLTLMQLVERGIDRVIASCPKFHHREQHAACLGAFLALRGDPLHQAIEDLAGEFLVVR